MCHTTVLRLGDWLIKYYVVLWFVSIHKSTTFQQDCIYKPSKSQSVFFFILLISSQCYLPLRMHSHWLSALKIVYILTPKSTVSILPACIHLCPQLHTHGSVSCQSHSFLIFPGCPFLFCPISHFSSPGPSVLHPTPPDHLPSLPSRFLQRPVSRF